VGTESNFPLPKSGTVGDDWIDGNISGRFDNADGVTGFTLDISEPDESEDVFVADGVGGRGEVGVEDDPGVTNGPDNCPAPQPEIHRSRTKMETTAIHAFVFIISFPRFGVPDRQTDWLTCRRFDQDQIALNHLFYQNDRRIPTPQAVRW
jgi:hypothetical protein